MTTTLRQIWAVTREPESHVLDMFSQEDLDAPLEVREVGPASLRAKGRQIRYLVGPAIRNERDSVIGEYRQNPGPPIVLMGNRILDGQHRAMAAYLERRLVESVQVENLSP